MNAVEKPKRQVGPLEEFSNPGEAPKQKISARNVEYDSRAGEVMFEYAVRSYEIYDRALESLTNRAATLFGWSSLVAAVGGAVFSGLLEIDAPIVWSKVFAVASLLTWSAMALFCYLAFDVTVSGAPARPRDLDDFVRKGGGGAALARGAAWGTFAQAQELVERAVDRKAKYLKVAFRVLMVLAVEVVVGALLVVVFS